MDEDYQHICDFCGEAVEDDANCTPDSTGHCIACGQKIAEAEEDGE